MFDTHVLMYRGVMKNTTTVKHTVVPICIRGYPCIIVALAMLVMDTTFARASCCVTVCADTMAASVLILGVPCV